MIAASPSRTGDPVMYRTCRLWDPLSFRHYAAYRIPMARLSG